MPAPTLIQLTALVDAQVALAAAQAAVIVAQDTYDDAWAAVDTASRGDAHFPYVFIIEGEGDDPDTVWGLQIENDQVHLLQGTLVVAAE